MVGFQITPDGSVGVHAVTWEPLYKAAKTAAAADPARLAYATSGGDIPAAITADARSYLDNAAAGRPAGEGLSAARAEFIRDFLGLPAHLTPEAGGLAALSGSSQPFLATLSLDRMNRVTPLDPVDALSGLQHDLDADSSWSELQFRPDYWKHLEGLIGPPPTGMFDPHARHVIFKAGREGAQKALVAEGHALLARYGIDPKLGEENLVWAPMRVKRQHSTETLRNAVERLKRIEKNRWRLRRYRRGVKKTGGGGGAKEMNMDENRQVMTIRSAIKRGDMARVRELFGQFPSLFAVDTAFGPWLHIAAEWGSTAAVAYLLEQGADIDRQGGTYGGSALNEAASAGHLEVVRQLLEAGAKMDTGDPRWNPLFGAAMEGSLEIVKLLVERGIDHRVSYTGGSMNDMDAEAFARERGQTAIADYLAALKKTGRPASA